MLNHKKTAHKLIVKIGLLAALLLIPVFIYSQDCTSNPIRVENCLPGDISWQINPNLAAYSHEIEGYASATSVNVGQQVRFHINNNTTARNRTVSIDIYRLGYYNALGARKITTSPISVPNVTSKALPVPNSQTGRGECNWVSETEAFWDVPANAVSGFYLAKLTGVGNGLQSYIPFVVRNDAYASKLLFKFSVTTHQAYNWYPGVDFNDRDNPANGRSFYDAFSGGPPLPGFLPGETRQARELSFNRPYGIISSYGVYDTLGVSFVSYEYPMLRWVEKEGYDVSYITDVDAHADPSLVPVIFAKNKHKVLLSVGHDEYWSWEMRDNIEHARDFTTKQQNIAFFSSNTSYWQIRFGNSSSSGTYPANAPNRTMICYKEYGRSNNGAIADPYYTDFNIGNDYIITDLWRNNLIKPPEDELIGVMTIPPGGDSTHPLVNGMYDPIYTPGSNPLILAGTAPAWLTAGTVGQSLDNLIGYESDELYPGNVYANHNPTIVVGSSPFYADRGTPGNPLMVLLGTAETTFYTTPLGAKVFAASGQQWSWGLDDWGADPAVGPVINVRIASMKTDAQRITKNILDCFSTNISCGN
jgi:hypothetical protein